MSVVKDLKNNEELVRNIVEDLEDFDDYATVTYEVWAIGYNKDGLVNGTDMLFGSFVDPDAAVKCAADISLADIIHKAAEEDNGKEPTTNTSCISIEVETVVDAEEGTMNIGTIYRKNIYLTEERVVEDEYADIVKLTSDDYRLRNDGTIRVSCNLLKDFSKNDTVQFMYVDEDTKPIMTYKIISKTTGNEYICEFIY